MTAEKTAVILFNNIMSLPIDYYAEMCRNILLSHMIKDYGISEDHNRYVRDFFYEQIVHSKKNNTYWHSKKAYQNQISDSNNKQTTLDHFITPRLMVSALIEERPDIIENKIEFKKIFELCTHVVRVTKEENSSLRFDTKKFGTIVVLESTEIKYNKLGHWYKKNGKAKFEYSVNFPLLNMIPTWFLDWERRLIVGKPLKIEKSLVGA